jgi:hypothetical protein
MGGKRDRERRLGPDTMSDATDNAAHPLPASAISGLVPALLRVYALAHDPSNAPVTATNTKELKDAVRISTLFVRPTHL